MSTRNTYQALLWAWRMESRIISPYEIVWGLFSNPSQRAQAEHMGEAGFVENVALRTGQGAYLLFMSPRDQ